MILILPISLLVFLRTAVVQGFTFYNISSDSLPGASQSCLHAVNADIACDYGLQLARQGYTTGFSVSDLALLCTQSCYTDLLAHRSSVASTCGTTQFYDSYSKLYANPTILDETLIYAYNLTCLVDRVSGIYCDTYYQKVENGTVTPSDCDPCNIEVEQFQLNSPLGIANDDTTSSFVSLTSSCRSSQYSTTTPSVVFLTTSPTPTYTPTCTGSKYTVQPGDTFHSVTKSQRVSTYILQSFNGFSSDTTYFPISGRLCIQSTCDLYTLQTNDTCRIIETAQNVTYAQVLAWNMNINPICSNLPALVGTSICVSNPAGNFTIKPNNNGVWATATTAAPIPSPTGSNTTSNCGQYYLVATGDTCATVALKFNLALDDFSFLNPEVWTNCTNLDLDVYYCVQPVGSISTYPSYPGATTKQPFIPTRATSLPFVNVTAGYTSTEPFIPRANNTRLDCDSYLWLDNITDSHIADCWSLAMVYGLNPEQLVLWNPSLGEGTSSSSSGSGSGTPTTIAYNYPCTISASSSYCVALGSPTVAPAATLVPPSPRAAGEVANCTNWIAPSSVDTCEGILVLYHLTIAQFYGFNPSVGDNCSKMALGTYFCVSTDPNGYAPGDGDDSSPTTTSSSPTRTGTAIVTPIPTQTGMITTCDKFYLVPRGSGCNDIATTYGIALSAFYAWNPAVQTDCSGLQANVYVCVGIEATTSSSSGTSTTSAAATSTCVGTAPPEQTQAGISCNCNSWVKQTAGVYCYDMAAAAKITLAQLYSLNPALMGDCSGLFPGYAYCLGVATVATSTSTSATHTTKTSSATATSTCAGGTSPPEQTQAGISCKCDSWVQQKAGVYCYDIAAAAGITLTRLYALNPALNGDCSGLWPGYAYCVAVAA